MKIKVKVQNGSSALYDAKQVPLYHKDTEPLYHSVMYSPVSLSSSIYSLPAMHSLLVTSDVINIRAYLALYLGGTPSQRTGTTPLAVYSSTTVYICHQFPIWKPIHSVVHEGNEIETHN